MHTNVLIKNVPVTVTVSRNLYGYTVYGYNFEYEGQIFVASGYHTQESAMKDAGLRIDDLVKRN